MRAGLYISLVITAMIILYIAYLSWTPVTRPMVIHEGVIIGNIIELPLPRRVSNMTVEEAILLRRSIRDYSDEPVKLADLSMILWSIYGVTETRWGLRAVPSAGGTYPLEVYVVIGERGVITADNRVLPAGVYKYEPRKHVLYLIREGDIRVELMRAAVGQRWVGEAPVSIVITAVYERTTGRYGERGALRYVPMEAGHAGQNAYLMATALGYGVVVVGAFIDEQVKSLINAGPNEVPLYIIPLGKPREPYRATFEDIQGYITSQRGG